MFDYKEEALYGWALFSFKKEDQEINVALKYYSSEPSMIIIFCEDGGNIRNAHDPKLSDTLDSILNKFDNNRNLDYFVSAL